MPSPPLADWTDLEGELAHWTAAGRRASFWWRDDDAVAATPALERLLALAGSAPLALAVIPGDARPDLAQAIAGGPGLGVLQHGWRHLNHAPAGEKKAELGKHRPLPLILQELAEGRARLSALFGARALPVLVPPWNRIDAALLPALPGIGFTGLSTILARPSARPVPGLRMVNTHADLVDWPSGHGFIGAGPALGLVSAHLAARRAGRADAEEPTGILTHHLVQDRATEDFLARLLALLRGHRGAELLPAAALFPRS